MVSPCHMPFPMQDVVYLQAWATARASGMAEMKKIFNDRQGNGHRSGFHTAGYPQIAAANFY